MSTLFLRRTAATIAVAPLLLALAACGPGTAPEASSPPSDAAPASPIPIAVDPGPALETPDGAVLSFAATATASSGAVLDIRVVVMTPEPYSADGAAPAVAATTAWCAGEVDDDVIAQGGYSFTTVDVTATARADTPTWPADAPLLVMPLPDAGATLAASGALRQVDEPRASGQEGGGVPHCAQPVLLDGAGTGRVFLGIAGDVAGTAGTAAFGGWAHRGYGVSSHLPGDHPAVAVTFGNCDVVITDAGSSLGAPSPSWTQTFLPDECVVGGVPAGQ